MPIRRQLLGILADGELHSGEALGNRLAISRMAVWKHIHALRHSGIPVEVIKGRGYRLPVAVELLDADAIRSSVSHGCRNQLADIEVVVEVDSTNSRLCQAAREGAPSGSVCVAELQHAGRGSHNRPWVSPFAASLYLSLLWRSMCGATGLGGLSLVTGIAVVRSLKSFGIDSAGLKWPNDVLVDGAKLAGILIDVTGESTGPCAVIIGIGINVSMPPAAAVAIDQHWTDLNSLTGREPVSRNRLAASVLEHLLDVIDEFERCGMDAFMDEWHCLDLVSGKHLDLQLPNETVPGRARGIDSAGALLVDTPTGQRRFASGEVRLRAGR